MQLPRYKGKEIANQSQHHLESTLKKHSDPEQTQKDKTCKKFGTHCNSTSENLQNLQQQPRTSSKLPDYRYVDILQLLRMTIRWTVQYSSATIGISVLTAMIFDHYAKECRKAKTGLKTPRITRKDVVCKQAEKVTCGKGPEVPNADSVETDSVHWNSLMRSKGDVKETSVANDHFRLISPRQKGVRLLTTPDPAQNYKMFSFSRRNKQFPSQQEYQADLTENTPQEVLNGYFDTLEVPFTWDSGSDRVAGFELYSFGRCDDHERGAEVTGKMTSDIVKPLKVEKLRFSSLVVLAENVSKSVTGRPLVEMASVKGRMPTKIELTLEQSQQGVSNDVLVSIEGVEELKRNVWIKGEKKAALHTT
ncbi:hypothetical protein Tco_1003363 [Tanacetum coccineum]|uniref:Uncharacterized protein n=1 Tax=Tanacetum coccineum TaxID=301880 RepID=A0ABQ5F929_9ASTR